nr:hypothetical protein [Tanacetum cinerariifolium]
MNEEEMFRVNDLDGDEVIVGATASEEVEQSTKVTEKNVSIADPVTTTSEVVTTTKGDELEQESAKRQRLKKEDDSTELKRCLEIVPEDDVDVTIEATPLSSKSPTIVDYNIYKEGKKSYFKIIRERFKKTKPVDDMDNLLFQTLKTMFEHHAKDNIQRYQQGIVEVLNWKLFDSCGVYCVTIQ